MLQRQRSVILGLITILCWGSLATFGNLLLHLPPFFVLGVTFLIGSIPAFFKFRLMFPSWKIVLWGVAGYFFYHFFLFYAFRFAPTVEANLINYLWPVIMVLITPVFFPAEKLRFYHVAGAAIAIIGSVFLVSSKGLELSFENMKGYLLALGAAITWPVYSIGKKKLGDISVWAVGGFCFLSGLLCLATHALIEPRVVLIQHDFLLLLLMGAGPFGLAFYLWDLSMKNGDPRVIGALAYLTPVLSTLGLVFFADQELTRSTFLAMILIFMGASAGVLDFFTSKR